MEVCQNLLKYFPFNDSHCQDSKTIGNQLIGRHNHEPVTWNREFIIRSIFTRQNFNNEVRENAYVPTLPKLYPSRIIHWYEYTILGIPYWRCGLTDIRVPRLISRKSSNFIIFWINTYLPTYFTYAFIYKLIAIICINYKNKTRTKLNWTKEKPCTSRLYTHKPYK